MDAWRQKLALRLPALVLLAATLLFWSLYDRYEPVGPPLLQSPPRDTASRTSGECSASEGRYTLTVRPGGPPSSLRFTVPDGADHERIRVRGRIRTVGVVVGEKYWRCARLVLIQYDAAGEWIPGHHGVVSRSGTRDWSSEEDVFEIDAQAARVDLVLDQTGREGTAEFDRLVVDAVRLRPSFPWWRAAFAGLWLLAGILYFRRCRLHRRRLRILILLNALAIIAGTLMPSVWLKETAVYAREETARIVEAARRPHPPADSSAVAAPAPQREEQLRMGRFSQAVGDLHRAGHFGLFAGLCLLVYLSAALERQHRSYYGRVAFDILLFAAVTESLQFLTLDRTPGFGDWLTDFYGMALALSLFLVLRGIIPGLRAKRESVAF